jgi:hypothetical protein
MEKLMVKYKITVNKDLEMVTVHYNLEVPVGGQELIADFSVFIDGKDVIEESASGNTKFFGTAFAKLANPEQDAAVNFAISSNTDFKADGADVLRGGHPFDDAGFSN